MRLIILAACVCMAVSAPAVQERGLLDSLTSLTSGTGIGSALKVIDAFGKVSQLISDLKNIAPEAHKALNSSIADIKNSMGNIVTDITKAIESGTTKSVQTRGLLDSLTSLTSGTGIGSALKVIDAFGKVSQLISDLKNIAPEAHKALNSTIEDIKNSMGNIVTDITKSIEGGATKSVQRRFLLDTIANLTSGSGIGSAFKVLDAFSKVSQLITDLKKIVPVANQALNNSVEAIRNSIPGIVGEITKAIQHASNKTVQTRGLLDSLSSLTSGTGIGSALKVIDAFGKVSQLISDLKNIAPEAHKALNSSIADIKNSMGNIVTDITKAIEGGATKSVQTRGLLDSLSSLTSGTGIGSALKVIDAFGKVSQLISDLKNIAPEAHKALNSSIADIKNSMGSIVTDITKAIEGGTTQSVQRRFLLDTIANLTTGTGIGSAFKVLDAFGKVSQLITDLKNIGPVANQALNNSVEAIRNTIPGIVGEIVKSIQKATNKTVQTRGLLDSLTSLTSGTGIGSALKVIDAFGKVSQLISDLKNIAPEAHKALNSSIADIKNSMGNIVTDITKAIEGGATKSVQTRGLLDSLTTMTDGTKLGSAMKVIDVFSKVSQLITDLKNIAPEAHQALNGSIEDIKNSFGHIVTDIAKTIDGNKNA
ncbi:uncharacterized protein LOC126828323 isoform X1 [Patella vulgata]|uniref:uncharacterized protein LOC126828323 isoform X1 n=1 Tax=Patella vulgata TaxID=6465 RepID=UPI0024A84ED1|nr:uncharacterized protein LOC126828323 isoform X1 [Patella vulgata]